MDEPEDFVRTTLYIERVGESRSDFAFVISRPTPSGENEYRCRVRLGTQVPTEIYGVDAIQALALTLAYAQHRFRIMVTEGWKFFMAESSSEPFDPCETYYPRLLPDSAPS